jgi:hypothetical protein
MASLLVRYLFLPFAYNVRPFPAVRTFRLTAGHLPAPARRNSASARMATPVLLPHLPSWGTSAAAAPTCFVTRVLCQRRRRPVRKACSLPNAMPRSFAGFRHEHIKGHRWTGRALTRQPGQATGIMQPVPPVALQFSSPARSERRSSATCSQRHRSPRRLIPSPPPGRL